MAGLLEKDIRLLWGTKQTLVILFAIAVAVAFSGNGNFINICIPYWSFERRLWLFDGCWSV